MNFKALRASKVGDTISTSLVDFAEADLMPGDLTDRDRLFDIEL